MARGKARGRETHGPKRGGGSGGGGDDSQRWLTTYSDMVTLVLAFFVILFSLSQIDVQAFQNFLRGLESAFGNPAYSNSLLDGAPAIVGDSFGGSEGDFADDAQTAAEQAAEELRVNIEGLQDTAQQIEEALREAGLEGVVGSEIDHRGLVLTIGTDAVLFSTGSTELSEQGRSIIAAIAPILNTVPNDVRVDGHTDNVPLRRPGYTNWNLSTDRSVAVLNLLHLDHRIEPSRLAATGYGEFRPRAGNETDQGRAMNRRVEIIVAVPGDQDGRSSP